MTYYVLSRTLNSIHLLCLFHNSKIVTEIQYRIFTEEQVACKILLMHSA